MAWEGRRGGVVGFRIGKYFSDPSPKPDDHCVGEEGCLGSLKKMCVFTVLSHLRDRRKGLFSD